MKARGFFVIVAFLSIFGVLLNSQVAQAVTRDPLNNPEKNALSLCSGANRRGAIWISGPGASYYDASVNVNATDNFVTVYIRGSVQNCGSASTGDTYAVDVAAQGANASRLTGLSDTTLYRGRSEGKNQWSTQGGQITATLNVTGLAPSSLGKPGTQSITIDLNRCFMSYNAKGQQVRGTCYPETLTVVVNRAALPYTYALSPSVTLSHSVAEYSTEVAVNAEVNSQGNTSSSGTQWQYTRTVVSPNSPLPGGGNSDSEPCAFYGAAVSECGVASFTSKGQTSATGGGLVIPTGRTVFDSRYTVAGDYAVGTRVCYALSLKNRSSTSSQWVHSTPACYVYSKKPKVQVLGGDLWAGRGSSATKVQTSVTVGAIRTPIQPPYNESMIAGLWQTGVDDTGKKLPAGTNDPHWTLSKVASATVSGIEYAHCQNVPAARAAKVVNTNLVTVGLNQAWKASIADAAWISANTNATNDSISSDPNSNKSKLPSCPFPAMSNTIEQSTFDKGPIWTFKLTNGFTVDQCVNPRTIQITARLAADDEVRIRINGVTVKDFHDGTPKHGGWPLWTGEQAMAQLTIGPNLEVFRTGSQKNELEIDVKSAWQYTGLLVASGIKATASCYSVTPGNVYGSYAEYGIAASGAVSGMASGAGYGARSSNGIQTKGASSADLCQLSILTFSNATATGCISTSIGGYTKLPATPPAVAAKFPVVASGANATPVLSGSVRLTDRPSGVYTASAAGLTLQAATIGKGRWYVLNAPNTDVVVQGNILYTNETLSGLKDIPQVIIIAKNITIRDSASRIDAWLVASGTGADGRINTCSADGVDATTAAGLTSLKCASQLKVNGPVIANHLLMRRTYGAGAGDAAGVPAEIFNLRPDAYMWMASGNWRTTTGATQLNSVSTRELPPRY